MNAAEALIPKGAELTAVVAAVLSCRCSEDDRIVVPGAGPKAIGLVVGLRGDRLDLPIDSGWAPFLRHCMLTVRHRIWVGRDSPERIVEGNKHGFLSNRRMVLHPVMGELRSLMQCLRTAAGTAASQLDSSAKPQRFGDSLRRPAGKSAMVARIVLAVERRMGIDWRQSVVAESEVKSEVKSSLQVTVRSCGCTLPRPTDVANSLVLGN